MGNSPFQHCRHNQISVLRLDGEESIEGALQDPLNVGVPGDSGVSFEVMNVRLQLLPGLFGFFEDLLDP